MFNCIMLREKNVYDIFVHKKRKGCLRYFTFKNNFGDVGNSGFGLGRAKEAHTKCIKTV